jgi:[protein-PII] uridylyltransferase
MRTPNSSNTMPHSPASHADAPIAQLKTQFRDGKTALLAAFNQTPPTARAAAQLTRALSRHVDQSLANLWRETNLPAGAALLAVGGYGRAELHPHSDVDVLVLLPASAAQDESAFKAPVEAFITACWDIGLEIGASVRTVADCVSAAQADITVQTALLESRLVCGAAP